MIKNIQFSVKTAVAAAILLFLSINFIGQNLFGDSQLDMTADNLYTLSDGSAAVVSTLEEPISIRYYFSEKLATPYPTLFRYGKRVKDTLQRFADLSEGKIRLQMLDPEPFSETEDNAVEAGIQGLDLGDGQKVYMGVVMEDSTDRATTIPYFPPDRERFLEYDLVKAIYSLSTNKLPKVAVISSLPLEYGPGGMFAMQQRQSAPYILWEQLQQFFNVSKLADDFSDIPADTDLLMLVHPGDLSDAQTYAIDQYVLGHGKAIVFVDPLLETASDVNPQNQFGPKPPADTSNLPTLFKQWGVQFDTDHVVADLELGQRVRVGDGFRGVKEFPHWMGIKADMMAKDDVVAGVTNTLNVISAGHLTQADGATTSFKPIITSGEVSMLIPTSKIKANTDPDTIVRDFTASDEKHTIAARVSGEVASAFTEAPKADKAEDKTDGDKNTDAASDDASNAIPAKHISSGQINVFVIADADMWVDRFWAMVQGQSPDGQRYISPIADNGSFIINAIDHLTGAEGLINLRARGETRRTFVRVDNIRKEAELRYLNEEQQLQQQIADTTARLTALEGNDPDAISPEQEAEIENFRTQLLEARKALREVQRNLRKDIDALESWLAFLNIALIPLLLFGLLLYRSRRRNGAA